MQGYLTVRDQSEYYKMEEILMDHRDISQVLKEENPEYRSLYEEHQSLENRLKELSSHLYLSDSEKVEEVTLKKKKLALKDRMQQMQKRHSQG
jgi:uncharacterized protein YdcH (DUF465 family)